MGYDVKKILVPLDGSQTSIRGLNQAISLAEQNQASITGLGVIHVLPTLVATVTPYRKYLVKQAEKNLRAAKQSVEKRGISFKSKIISGSPGSKIVDTANKEKFDLIVIGSRGLGPVKEAFLGSVSHYVTHKARTPVLLVK